MGVKGRPKKYNKKIANRICDLIAGWGEMDEPLSMREIGKLEGMPSPSVIYAWLRDNNEFQEQYTRAREAQADFYADEMIEIADDSSGDLKTITVNGNEKEVFDNEFAARSKIRIDARKWKASKLAPKKYGDKQEIEHKGYISLADAYAQLKGEQNN